MIAIDSSGWIQMFEEGSQAHRYLELLEGDEDIIVPTIVIYEVCKITLRERGAHWAELVGGVLQGYRVEPLTTRLAMEAAEVSLKHRLAMADAIVYATAQMLEATLVTSDEDFADLPGVTYLPRDSG